jgi:hypothetical protein
MHSWRPSRLACASAASSPAARGHRWRWSQCLDQPGDRGPIGLSQSLGGLAGAGGQAGGAAPRRVGRQPQPQWSWLEQVGLRGEAHPAQGDHPAIHGQRPAVGVTVASGAHVPPHRGVPGVGWGGHGEHAQSVSTVCSTVSASLSTWAVTGSPPGTSSGQQRRRMACTRRLSRTRRGRAHRQTRASAGHPATDRQGRGRRAGSKTPGLWRRPAAVWRRPGPGAFGAHCGHLKYELARHATHSGHPQVPSRARDVHHPQRHPVWKRDSSPCPATSAPVSRATGTFGDVAACGASALQARCAGTVIAPTCPA